MKKLFLLAMIALASVGINAQTVKGEGSLMGNIGYQTNYERFGLGVQGRYAIANNLRIAPDVTFYFPKDKVTGLDVSVNFHYVFNFKDGFKRDVISRFICAYESGATPNPCIDCNRFIKFKLLFDRAKILGCDFIATGHYARIEQ